LPNGTSFWVEFVWQGRDGEQWGVGYTTMQGKRYSGWVAMSELAVIYDHLEFVRDHEAEFAEYDGSGDSLSSVLLYSYPGGVVCGSLDESPSYMTFAESFQNLYTDENGLRWTFVGYYMGRHDAWVCIDDPLNDGLGVDTYLTANQVRDSGNLVPAENTPPARTIHLWLVVAVLVIVVVAVTAVLIRRRKRA